MLNFFATVATLAILSLFVFFVLSGALYISNFLWEGQQAGHLSQACLTLATFYAYIFMTLSLVNCVGSLCRFVFAKWGLGNVW